MYNEIWNGIESERFQILPAHSAGFFVMAEKKQCGFCSTEHQLRNLSKYPRSHFFEYGIPRPEETPIIRTENIAVFSDVLPAEPNGLHFLVVPTLHAQAFAQRSDLKDELGYVIARVEEEFGTPMIRGEHGGGDPNMGYLESRNQSVYHQHMHLVGNPNGLDILEWMKDEIKRKEGIKLTTLHGLDGTPTPILRKNFTGHPYLFIQQGPEGVWAEDVGDTFRSQILQRNLSNLLSGDPLNWKLIPSKPDLARLSAQRIMKVFDQCKR